MKKYLILFFLLTGISLAQVSKTAVIDSSGAWHYVGEGNPLPVSLGYTGEFAGLDSLFFMPDTGSVRGDSLSNYSPEFQYETVYLTYQDTGLTTAAKITDSLKVYSYNPDLEEWVLTSVIDVNGDTVTTVVGNSGNTVTFKVNEKRPYRVKVELINHWATFPLRKGYVSWSGRN